MKINNFTGFTSPNTTFKNNAIGTTPEQTNSLKLKPQPQVDSFVKSNNKNSQIRIAYINDFHGQLTKMGRTVLPLKDYDLRLSGGDNFLGDEQNIGLNKGVARFMNLANIDFSPIGNHELDMDQK